MDLLIKQFALVFGGQGSHYYWYIGIILAILIIALIFVVFKSKHGDFRGEVEQLKNMSGNYNELLKQHRKREKELENTISEKEAMIANYEQKLARLEQKK